jgi:hypothetical protein
MSRWHRPWPGPEAWLLTLLLIGSPAVHATSPQAFEAKYQLLSNGQHLADTRVRLAQRDGVWVWSMQSKPRGVYRWFTSKQPFAETHLVKTADGWQPLIEVSGDYPERTPKRAAWFDHGNQKVFYSSRKNQRTLDFKSTLYSDQTIHLAYARMKARNERETRVPLYRNGRVISITLRLEPGVNLEHDGKQLKVDRLTQSQPDKERKTIYHYDQQQLAPLRIEQIRDGESTIMLRERFKRR